MKKKFLSVVRSVPGAVLSVALVLAVVSATTARPAPATAEGGPLLSGFAWSENIGWISFSAGNDHDPSRAGTQNSPVDYAVTVDAATGALSGYAWSSNIGWVKFGGLSSFPSGGSGGNATLENGLRLKGWARACAGTATGSCSTMNSRTDGWDGWISLAGTTSDGGTYGVTLDDREFGGFAWGSEVVGWVDWTGVFSNSEVGACFGPNGEQILNGESRTYYGPKVGDTCPEQTRTCTNGVLSGTLTSLTCGQPLQSCERAGITLAEGESHTFYSERLVSGSSPVCAGQSDLRACCDSTGELLTCTAGALVGTDGLPDTEHEFVRCSLAPTVTEF
jgi:hypothetical protein